MDEEHAAGNKTRKCQAVADPLHEGTGRTKSWRRNIGSAVVVDHDSDDQVDKGHDGLGYDQGLGVVAGVPHLRDDGEEGWSSSECEDNGRDRRNSLSESGVTNDFEVLDVRAILRSISRAVLDTDRNGQSEDCSSLAMGRPEKQQLKRTSSQDSCNTNPGDPGDLAQCLDATEKEPDKSCDYHENGSAGAVD